MLHYLQLILFLDQLLSDAETVRWLNYAVEKIWPVCMERVASQQLLLPIIPWFLDKFKPWTVRKAVIQNLYLGRNAPMFTDIRVVSQSTDDDHLVCNVMSSVHTVKMPFLVSSALYGVYF